MKNYVLALICICFLFNTYSTAQILNIRLVVQNKQQTPIEVGNVLLLSPIDSTVLSGDVFYNGEVKLNTTLSGEVILKITALGYTDFHRNIQLEDNTTLNLGTIYLEPQMLEEVIVLGRNQIAEQRGGALVVNVENTALENMGSAIDVLRNLPKVNLARGNQVQVVGKGTALIYLDGQLITSTELLNSLASKDLKSVEVIENPSAKYDAAGQAVINIRTKRKTLEGFKIGLTQELGKGYFWRAFTHTDLYYRAGKFLFQGNYGYNHAKFWATNHYGRTYEHLGKTVMINNKYPFTVDRGRHQFGLKTLFQISEKGEIGFNYTGNLIKADRAGNSRNNYFENGNLQSQIHVTNTGPFQQQNNIAQLYYNQQLNENGGNLSIAAQYATYDLERTENINQILDLTSKESSSESVRRTDNSNDIQLRSVQLDYYQPLSKGWVFESGFKIANIQNISVLDFGLLENDGNYTSIPEFSTDYNYQENILAAYTQVNWQIKKVTANVGLRGEWTMNEGEAAKENGKNLISNDYKNLFPSASILTEINENLTVGLNYNYRIQRPAFQDLNPFTFFADSLVSFRGNPLLRPEYSHNTALSFDFKKVNLSLNYAFTKDKINTIVIIDNPEEPAIFDFFRDNTLSTTLYSANLSFPVNTKWYVSYNSFTARFDDHRNFDRKVAFSNTSFGVDIQSNHTFYMPKGFTLELFFRYNSPRVDGIYTDRSIGMASLGISRSFFNKSLTTRLYANDIFRGFRFQGTYDVYDNEWTYLNAGDFRYVKLSLNWNFGKLKPNKVGKNKLSNSELNRINW